MIRFLVQRANTHGRAQPGLELQGKHSNSTPSTSVRSWMQGAWDGDRAGGGGGGECVVGAGLRSHIPLFLPPEGSNQYFCVLILKWKTLGYQDSMAVPGGGPLPFEVFPVNRLFLKNDDESCWVWEVSRSFRKSQSFVLGLYCYPGDTNTCWLMLWW